MWNWQEAHRWLEGMKAKGLIVRGGKTQAEYYARPVDRFERDKIPPVELVKLLGLFTPEQQDAAADALMGLDTDPVACANWWHERLLDDKKRMSRYPVRVLTEQGPQALTESPRLTVGTIHSVKGGEADIVYVFPDLSRQGYVESWAQQDTRAQTIRLFYVAFTRARERLVIGASSEPTFVPLPPPKESHE
jgi:hypothetical protein